MNIVFLDEPAAQPHLLEAIREEAHAAGPVQRQWLHERVSRRMGAERDDVVQGVDDLLRAGDLVAGHGLVGPAPLRAVPLQDGEVLLVGSRPNRFLEEDTTDGVPRRAKSVPSEALEVPLERWTGIDRASLADEAYLRALTDRAPEDDGEDWSQAYGWRDGRFRPEPEATGLWRLRMPGGWFRYAWVDEQGLRPLTTDEGLRAAFALARDTEAARLTFRTTDEGVEVKLPRMPRPEYRFMVACGSRGTDWAWRVPLGRWGEVRTTLSNQLGIDFEETHGEA